MIDTSNRLFPTSFPKICRETVDTLQVNLGYLCNQSCNHCHVNAGPKRSEQMQRETIEQVLRVLDKRQIGQLDLTGGAPEMNPHFRFLVSSARELGVTVIDRCNLTILQEAGYEWLPEFLAEQGVEMVASMPCYLEENVNSQRGKGVFASSIKGLQRLNALGYGDSDGALKLNLVYNPLGPTLPPSQSKLEDDYKQRLHEQYNIRFNQLFTITNMPISRFGSMLISKGEFDDYLQLLKGAYSEANLQTVMCKNLVSVDWQGFLYDCDFNQMLKLPVTKQGRPFHIADLEAMDLTGLQIWTGEHCYGCTAGQGSSCGGALAEAV